MTPKEKAKELCYKFMIHNSYQSIVWYNARICALIAVEEVLILCWNGNLKAQQYWREVKQEILNL